MTRILRRRLAASALALAFGAARADTLPDTTCPLTAGERTCTLFARTGTVDLPGAPGTTIWGYSATDVGPVTSPGPVLVVNEGETVNLSVTNALGGGVATSLRVSGAQASLASIAATATGTLHFVASAPGTYLYEAGLLPGTQYQVAMGLHGVLVVRPSPAPATPQAYADPASAYDDEALVVLSELDPALNGSADPSTFDLRGFAPRFWLLNGTTYPGTADVPTAPGRRVLLRYANAGLESHTMALLGLPQSVLAFDGALTPRPLVQVAPALAAGQTADAVVTVPAGTAPGTLFPLYDGHLTLDGAGAGLGGMLTFLTTGTGTPGGGGPVTSSVAAAPSPTNGAVDVAVTALVTGASVAGAELFLDAPGANGSGIAMAGAFPGTAVAVSGAIPVATLAGLPAGSHPVYVHGQDAGGAWGPVSATVIVVDSGGPATTAIVLAPATTSGAAAVAVSATGDDRAAGGSNVDAAELFVDPAGSPPAGTGQALTAGVVSTVTSFTGAIPASVLGPLTPGVHVVAIRAHDTLGNWGPLATASLRVDRTGPVASAVLATPAATNGSQGVSSGNQSIRLTATLTDDASAVAAGEAFVDTAGATGTGFVLLPTDGRLDALSETTFADIPLATVNQLTQGTHALLVRGRDAAGNWGATSSTPLVFEKGVPTVSGVAVAPNPTAGAVTVTLTATAADPAPTSGISAAEWFSGADPGAGNGTPMQAADGAFGGAPEALTATIDVVARGWANGTRTVSVRARDAAGTWSALATVSVTVQLPEDIFADGFESGSFSAWNGGTTGVGLNVTTAAHLTATGTFGMAVTAGAGARYVTDNTPAGDATYRARFWFNPNGTLTGGNVWDLFQGVSGAQIPFRVQYQRTGGGLYQVRAQLTTSAGGTASTPFVTITNAAHALEVAWAAGTGAGTRLQFYVDGALQGTLSGQNTSPFRVEAVRLGRPAGTNGSSTGTFYLDQFVSRRTTLIGP